MRLARLVSSLAAWMLLIPWAACAAPQMTPPSSGAPAANPAPAAPAAPIDRADEVAARAEGSVVCLLERVSALAILNTAIISLALVVAQRVGIVGSFQPGRHGSIGGGG